MAENPFAEKLRQFGLTRQEAVLYQCLLGEGKSSGYELAKLTGISRSNVYAALSALVDKGGARIQEEGRTSRYTPVELEEFCENHIRHLQETKEWLVRHVPADRAEEEGYITIKGTDNIVDKVRYLLTHTRERVYLVCESRILGRFMGELEALAAEGKKVVILTDRHVEVKGEQVRIYDCAEEKGTIGVISDSSFALTGSVGAGAADTCLYSGQKTFVELYKRALANEIELQNYRNPREGEEKTNEETTICHERTAGGDHKNISDSLPSV